jgi:uncharacterized protein YxeA
MIHDWLYLTLQAYNTVFEYDAVQYIISEDLQNWYLAITINYLYVQNFNITGNMIPN